MSIPLQWLHCHFRLIRWATILCIPGSTTHSLSMVPDSGSYSFTRTGRYSTLPTTTRPVTHTRLPHKTLLSVLQSIGSGTPNNRTHAIALAAQYAPALPTKSPRDYKCSYKYKSTQLLPTDTPACKACMQRHFDTTNLHTDHNTRRAQRSQTCMHQPHQHATQPTFRCCHVGYATHASQPALIVHTSRRCLEGSHAHLHASCLSCARPPQRCREAIDKQALLASFSRPLDCDPRHRLFNRKREQQPACC
jgi:hypothetical protein